MTAIANSREPLAGRGKRSGWREHRTPSRSRRHRQKTQASRQDRINRKRKLATRHHIRRLENRGKNLLKTSRKAAKNKDVRDTDSRTERQRQTRRDEDEEEDEEEDDRDEKDDEEDKERYNEYLVKKDINDYFAQSSKNAAEEDEVFDRSERADESPTSSGITQSLYLYLS